MQIVSELTTVIISFHIMQAAEVLKIRGRATRSDNIPDFSALELGTTTHMHTCHACA